MDWVEEWVERLGEKVRNLELKYAMAVYILIAVLVICISSLITIQICSGWINIIDQGYSEKKIMYKNGDGVKEVFHFELKDYSTLSKPDIMILECLEMIQRFCVIFYSVIAVVLVSKFYYRDRLQKPIQIMTQAAEHIAENDMSYSCRYDSDDEMGRLCNCFDNMRRELIAGQEAIWKQMEEQKILNAAFAHDMRTPLTVLEGYVDMLVRYYPQGNTSQEKMTEILETMQGQLHRLKSFTGTMKEIHSLEERKLGKKPVTLQMINEKLERTAEGLRERNAGNADMTADICFSSKGEISGCIWADTSVILEVAENLLSNALRYARNRIDILVEYEKSKSLLLLYVRDDGPGFEPGETEKAAAPYYRGNADREGEHFGLGLSICHTLCQKHGGTLEMTNSIRGGAIICAGFCCGEDNSHRKICR